MITMQTVAIDSKDGRVFLRKVQKHNLDAPSGEDWGIYAGDRSKWAIQFRRTVKGATGEPDREVEVMTDGHIGKTGRVGMVQSFEYCKPVCVLQSRGVNLHGSTAALAARLLADGWRFEVCHSGGSTASSEHGLAFYDLMSRHPDFPYARIVVGGGTVTIDGTRIIAGDVMVG